ncbi:MAG: hypothetical protein K0Q73_8588 [Paenibacillus sp.]|nr:hypothetical protein [Paenibacillus sp.]
MGSMLRQRYVSDCLVCQNVSTISSLLGYNESAIEERTYVYDGNFNQYESDVTESF